MDSSTLDPYEQQLLSVFNSYDHDNLGSLDQNGLKQLCQTLQLEEQGSELISNLIQDPKHSRATFIEFKDALLNLLGNMQKQENDNHGKKVEGSPEREVSPKFVYGSKKYGRRSRPKSDDITNVLEDHTETDYISTNNSVQRSNSHLEVSNSKKRKTNYKLKRCTSLPSNRNNNTDNFIASNLNDTEFICTEEMLREAWKKLGVGKDGYLNQRELILVCDAIGLHKLAEEVIRQLSSKLTLDVNHRISFQELLEALQQDETWLAVLDNSTNDVDEITTTDFNESNNIYTNSRGVQYITLGPNGNGYITADNLVEMWEAVGISSPKELIHELGFNNREINVVELATILDKEIKGMNETSRLDVQNPHVALLHANLTLYQSEIRCLKNIMEQMYAEREKLKCDVIEANNRATLLAQEVDDNHIRMEMNTQNQVKLLEQRHSDILKDISMQFASDKEQLSNINQELEKKVNVLEQEVQKLKDDLNAAHSYTMNLEKENQIMLNKIADLEQAKEIFTNQISCLEAETHKYAEMEHEQIEPLLSKLSDLQIENARLRDKNDEMVAEIENLTMQVTTMKTKVSNSINYNSLDQSMEENISFVSEGVGLGAKRRSECSPTKDNILFGTVNGGSPRIGKVPKFLHTDLAKEELTYDYNESGFSTDSNEETQILNNENDVQYLENKVLFLEQTLAQHSIALPNFNKPDTSENDVIGLKKRVEQLEHTFNNLHEIKKMITQNGLNSDNLKSVGDKLETLLSDVEVTKNTTEASTETDLSMITLEELIKKYETENQELTTKCQELENCVDLLKNEYEKCEDYWQSKLEEERQIFEQEQNQSSEKLADLIAKMTEYEEQFANQDCMNHLLPPIEESENLEKQFTDLEQEFEEYKVHSENAISERDEEITLLKEKLTELALKNKEQKEAAIQVTDDYIQNKMSNLSLCLTEQTSLTGEKTNPPQQQWPCPSEQIVEKDYENFPCIWNNTKSSSVDLRTETSSCNNGQPSSSNSSTMEKSTTPCRPKRTRKHERYNILYKKNNQEKGMKKTDDGMKQEQFLMMPISTVHNLNGRLHHLEQRCRQLQLVLKQQHYFTEQSLQQCRQYYKGEKAELQCLLKSHQEKLDQQVRICNEQLERLARSDMLVKELYVENSYLIAKVQRLEQQCNFLAQCNSNSCSV